MSDVGIHCLPHDCLCVVLEFLHVDVIDQVVINISAAFAEAAGSEHVWAQCFYRDAPRLGVALLDRLILHHPLSEPAPFNDGELRAISLLPSGDARELLTEMLQQPASQAARAASTLLRANAFSRIGGRHPFDVSRGADQRGNFFESPRRFLEWRRVYLATAFVLQCPHLAIALVNSTPASSTGTLSLVLTAFTSRACARALGGHRSERREVLAPSTTGDVVPFPLVPHEQCGQRFEWSFLKLAVESVKRPRQPTRAIALELVSLLRRDAGGATAEHAPHQRHRRAAAQQPERAPSPVLSRHMLIPYAEALRLYDALAQRHDANQLLRDFPLRCLIDAFFLYILGIIGASVSINWAILRMIFPGPRTHDERGEAFRNWQRRVLPRVIQWVIDSQARIEAHVHSISLITRRPLRQELANAAQLVAIPFPMQTAALLVLRLGSIGSLRWRAPAMRLVGPKYVVMRLAEEVVFSALAVPTAFIFFPTMFKIYRPLLSSLLTWGPRVFQRGLFAAALMVLVKRLGEWGRSRKRPSPRSSRYRTSTITSLLAAGVAVRFVGRVRFHQIFFGLAKWCWGSLGGSAVRASLAAPGAMNEAARGDETAVYGALAGSVAVAATRSLLVLLPRFDRLRSDRTVALSSLPPRVANATIRRLIETNLDWLGRCGGARSCTTGRSAMSRLVSDLLGGLQGAALTERAKRDALRVAVEEVCLWGLSGCMLIRCRSLWGVLSWRLGVRVVLDLLELAVVHCMA